jgi:sulfate adenylyltransferase subunit 1 (EFTu-like GTPase family)
LSTRIARIVTYDGDLEQAQAPLSVTLTLEDEIDISRGDLLAAGTLPLAAKSFEATVVWFDRQPFDASREYLIKHTSQVTPATIESQGLAMNDIGKVTIHSSRALFIDSYKLNRETGAFILIDRQSNATVAAGMIL